MIDNLLVMLTIQNT